MSPNDFDKDNCGSQKSMIKQICPNNIVQKFLCQLFFKNLSKKFLIQKNMGSKKLYLKKNWTKNFRAEQILGPKIFGVQNNYVYARILDSRKCQVQKNFGSQKPIFKARLKLDWYLLGYSIIVKLEEILHGKM